MKLKRHKQFNKDFSKVKLTDEQFGKFIVNRSVAKNHLFQGVDESDIVNS